MGRSLALAVALLGTLTATTAAAQPRVATSVLPLQSLAAGVMAGIGEPTMLVSSAGTPHSYSLRPSEARLLNEATIVFWIGPEYETFLVKPIGALGGQSKVVPLMKASGVTPLPAREGGTWDSHGHDHKHTHKPGVVELDAHVFLDTANAKAMVTAMARALGEADAANRERYEANAQTTRQRIDALDSELRALLEPVRGVPYIVFHDGYQYFEKRYGLNAVGSITVSPERTPGARRLGEIRRKIERLKAACVFGEPQFETGFVRTVSEGTKARIGLLDYIGIDQSPGPDAYFGMMRGLGRSLTACLGG